MTNKYRDTVFLPKTSLPMKAKPEAELPLLARWESEHLYQTLRDHRVNAKPFTLFDGPPYANGDIHIGHALNKILKDIVVRGRNLLGSDAPFRPGWDCRGLPIEWKVEEEWRKHKRDKNDEPDAFRADCRAFAQKWVDVQREQFKRLGVLADWDNPYLTMSPESAATIIYNFHRMVEAGLVYRAKKPVLWSPVEKTALAEAETVDHTHIVPNIWVRFAVRSGSLRYEHASLLVWTTTPWSLPGNVAVAYNPTISYGLYATPSGLYVVADSLAEQAFVDEAQYERVRDVTERDLNGTCHHPLGDGYVSPQIIPAAFVRDNAGTGFVHVGPAHSSDDWVAWRNYGGKDAAFPNPILPNGTYADDVPVFYGLPVTKGKRFGPANEAIVAHLDAQGTLYRREDRPLTVQHSWRSDAVLLTLATDQFFITIGDETKIAMGEELVDVDFIPPRAEQRMASMISARPDWLVSRQRLWGTPMAIFVHRETGEILCDSEILAAVHQELTQLGADSWWNYDHAPLFKSLGRDDAADYARVDDVLDVWFDSGCVHSFGDVQKADMVIEGSDQSRGWFASMLTTSVLTGRAAPYRTILTHGFVLDANGEKMAKSKGNVVDPLVMINKYGADVLRAWVAGSDVTEDLRVSDVVFATHEETCRKIRNTMKYMVGALDDAVEDIDSKSLPELERYILSRVEKINADLADMLAHHHLTSYMTMISNFCTRELSSLLIDIRKDSLYCDSKTSQKRNGYLWVLDQVFSHMVRWIAPVMVFAAEELYQARNPSSASVHLLTLPDPSGQGWRDFSLEERWSRLIEYRAEMLGMIEHERAAGRAKSSTELSLDVYVVEQSQAWEDLREIDIAEFAITGKGKVEPVSQARWTSDLSTSTIVEKLTTPRCDRCWKVVEVTTIESLDGEPDTHLCERCHDVVVD